MKFAKTSSQFQASHALPLSVKAPSNPGDSGWGCVPWITFTVAEAERDATAIALRHNNRGRCSTYKYGCGRPYPPRHVPRSEGRFVDEGCLKKGRFTWVYNDWRVKGDEAVFVDPHFMETDCKVRE